MKTQSILKTALLAASFSAFALIGSAQAQIINVQFLGALTAPQLDGTPYDSTVSPLSYTGSTWNVILPGNNGPGLVDSNNNSTGVGFIQSSPDGYLNTAGYDPSVPLINGMQIDNVTDTAATLTITGLTDGDTYNLALVSQQTGRGGDFTISGYGSLSNSANAYPSPFTWTDGVQYVEFSGVAPVSGDITVTITSSRPMSDTYAALNGFQIQEVPAVPEPSTYALLGLGALALVVISRRRKA